MARGQTALNLKRRSLTNFNEAANKQTQDDSEENSEDTEEIYHFERKNHIFLTYFIL